MRLPGLPGRNDAFGLLSAILLNSPQPYAPVKFGLVWNVDQRIWVHWDGNTMRQLLTLPNERATTFHRGSHRYDPAQMGYTDEGAYLLDTSVPGNANSGHDYGTDFLRQRKKS